MYTIFQKEKFFKNLNPVTRKIQNIVLVSILVLVF